MSESPSSMNRGPGALDNEAAGLLRNKVSQHETTSKKRKITCTFMEGAAKRQCSGAGIIGGKGLEGSFYLATRHLAGKAGRPIPLLKQISLDRVHTPVKAQEFEVMTRQHIPKFNVDPNHPVNTYHSGPFPLPKCLKLGLKQEICAEIEPARAACLANLGVDTLNTVIAELQANDPHGPPPTEDEFKAVMQLMFVEAMANRFLPNATRTPITKAYND